MLLGARDAPHAAADRPGPRGREQHRAADVGRRAQRRATRCSSSAARIASTSIARPRRERRRRARGPRHAGQILVSEQTAAQLPIAASARARSRGAARARRPSTRAVDAQDAAASPSDEEVAHCLSTALRAHLLAAPAIPSTAPRRCRSCSSASSTRLIAAEGAPAAADAVDEVVRAAQEAADRYEICILGSDIAADGGKLLFSAGAPRAIGDDEERMLLAMRHIIDARHAPPGARRRHARLRLHRRGRAALPAHLRGHGRRRQPRRAPVREGALARGLHDRRRCSSRAHAALRGRPRCRRSWSRARAGRSRRSRSAPRCAPRRRASPPSDAVDRPRRRARDDRDRRSRRALRAAARSSS